MSAPLDASHAKLDELVKVDLPQLNKVFVDHKLDAVDGGKSNPTANNKLVRVVRRQNIDVSLSLYCDKAAKSRSRTKKDFV
jgi:hypothetical protein